MFSIFQDKGRWGTNISAFECPESLHPRLCFLFPAHLDENAKALCASAACLGRHRSSGRGLWSSCAITGEVRDKGLVIGVVQPWEGGTTVTIYERPVPQNNSS
jgi:hypothetical protein